MTPERLPPAAIRSELAGDLELPYDKGMPDADPLFPKRRRSASAEAALRAEIARVNRMSIEERVKAALSMKERFSWVTPSARPK